MSNNKLDRGSLRREAQRKESYATLVSKRKYMLSINGNEANKKSRTETKHNFRLLNSNNKEIEEESKDANRDYMTCLSPSSTNQSSHSDSSQDFQPDLLSNNKKVQPNRHQHEVEVSSVMTRSATRKYASVGALHNKVDWDQQLKVGKRWPIDVAYTIQGPLVENTVLRDLLSRSMIEVMSFCKYAWSVKNEEIQTPQESLEFGDSSRFIRLAPYPTHEPEMINGNDKTQIFFHLNNNSPPQQLINIIPLHEEEQRETLCIQQENEDCETITLHSSEAYLLAIECDQINIEDNIYLCDPMMAVLNDHNYAQKCDVTPISKFQAEHFKIVKKEEKKEFKLETALNDLLLNTAMLKCLVCGESPEEMISFLDKAQASYC